MPFRDLREFIEKVREIGELKIVKGAHWDLEIGCLGELMAEQNGPALLFDEIIGYPQGYRVFLNAFTTLKRTALLFDLPQTYNGLEIINRLYEKHKAFTPIKPREVNDGPVMEEKHIGDDVNLFEFPSPRWKELDGGRYIGTGCICVMRDPEEGRINVGTYRVIIHDKNTAGIMISPGKDGYIIMQKYHSKGLSCPIAISLGCDPQVYYASFMPLSWSISEYDYAGWIRGSPVDVLKAPLTGLPVPATSEIVLEGEIPPPSIESREEGPFGEWTGYYVGERAARPVIRVKAIYHRYDPIILGNPHYKPPTPSTIAVPYKAVQVWAQLESAGIPGIKGVWALTSKDSLLIIVISIHQMYSGHSKQAGLVAASCKAGGYVNRMVIVVDDDIDITDPEDVLWAVATRADFEKIDIIKGGWSSISDSSIPPEKIRMGDLTNTRIIIDGCIPYHRRGDFPKVNKSSQELREKVVKKFYSLFS